MMPRRLKTRLTMMTLAFVTLVSQPGCFQFAAKNQFLKDDFRTETILLPMTLLKVDIADRRKPAKNKELKVSNLSLPGKEEQVNAPLSDELKVLIQSEMVNYFTGKGPKVRAHVELMKGLQIFSTKWTGEKEQVDCNIRVTLVDIASNQPFVWGEGSFSTWVQSIDASKAYIDKLFAKGIRASLYKSIESIRSAVGN